jgi:hypothetical protein
MARLCGFKVIETSVGAGTVTVVEPLIPAALAVTVPLPSAALVAKPVSLASLLTANTLEDEDLHSTDDKICVLPPLKVPVATSNCCVPTGTDGVAGEIAMLVSPVNWLVV